MTLKRPSERSRRHSRMREGQLSICQRINRVMREETMQVEEEEISI